MFHVGPLILIIRGPLNTETRVYPFHLTVRFSILLVRTFIGILKKKKKKLAGEKMGSEEGPRRSEETIGDGLVRKDRRAVSARAI